MLVSINNPVTETYIFSAILLAAVFLTAKKKTVFNFSPELTGELKGFAILAVVFSHIGYFLSADTRFLFPLSILAGVGVNLFLFLSGFGLTASAIRKKFSRIGFYRRRLGKLFFPLWIILTVFFLLDYFVLKIGYSPVYAIRSYLGFFPHADLWSDLDAPLWYFTFILFSYLVFPLVFIKKQPWISALAVYFASYFIIRMNPAVLGDVIHLYRIHIAAFPLGMIFGNLACAPGFFKKITGSFSSFLAFGRAGAGGNSVFRKRARQAGYAVFSALLIFVIGYTAIHSGVGGADYHIEELISLITAAAVILLFYSSPLRFRFFSLFGLYSYEIYLFHWPILYRYDFIYTRAPAWLATALYLGLFLALGAGLRAIIEKIGRQGGKK